LEKSIEKANEIKERYPDAVITFVGYSKGGAEAAANAAATGKDAVLFNPAIPNLRAYGLSLENYEANMVSYIIEGELLSETIGKISEIPGEKKFLEEDYNLVDKIFEAYKEHLSNLTFKNIWENADEFLKEVKEEIDYSTKLHSLNSFYKKE